MGYKKCRRNYLLEKFLKYHGGKRGSFSSEKIFLVWTLENQNELWVYHCSEGWGLRINIDSKI
jgi:hypothetical protein